MKLWAWVMLMVFAVAPLEVFADEQVIGIGGTYWTQRQAEDNDEDCVLTQTGGLCMLVPAGDEAAGGFNPLNMAVVFTAGAAGIGCYVSDPAYTIDGSDVDGVGAAAGGSCPFSFESSSGGRFDDRPSRKQLLAAGAAGIDAGICSVANTNSGDRLFASCAVGAAGDTLCAAYDDGVTTGTCLAWDAAAVTPEMRARVGVFLVFEFDDAGPANYTVRKQGVTK